MPDMEQTELEEIILALGAELCQRKALLATAESCTGGLIAHEATNVSGSSRWFAGGVVAYANHVKQHVLGVPETVLAIHGAVSRETVRAMAQGAQRLLGAQAALAVSGIAGPDGGTPEKPVGTVWAAWTLDDTTHSALWRFFGTRLEIKRQTSRAALEGMLDMVRKAG